MAKDYKSFSMNELSSSTNLYTVPSGKKFYLQEIFISVRNTSTSSVGQFGVGKDGVGLIFAGVPQAATTAVAPSAYIQHELVGDGLPFEAGTVISFMEIAGTLIANGRIAGFEHDA